MSSACLMAMEILMELMEGSMSTFSFSFRLTTTAVMRSSLLDLKLESKIYPQIKKEYTNKQKYRIYAMITKYSY